MNEKYNIAVLHFCHLDINCSSLDPSKDCTEVMWEEKGVRREREKERTQLPSRGKVSTSS